MVSYEWLTFKELRQMQNSKKPFNSPLFVENTIYGLYFVDSADQDVLLKTTDEGVTVSTVDLSALTHAYKIQALWHDRANNKIYGGASDNQSVNGVAFYIDLASSDAETEMSVFGGFGVDIWDVFKANGSFYAIVDHVATGIEDMSAGGAVITNLGKNVSNASFAVVIEPDAYFLVEDGGNTEMIFFDESVPSVTSMDTLVGYTIPTDRNLAGLAYDGNNIIYFILTKTADGKEYLCTYNINTTTITDTGLEYNVSLMLDRNTLGTSGSPWEFEKAFHLTSPYVYQINRGIDYLLKIQDIELTGGETIVAISDKYLITSNSDLYRLTESIAELHTARASYQTHRTPKGIFSHASEFSTDQLIEIFQYIDPDYTLVFRGKMGTPRYDQRRAIWNYSINNMGFDDLKEKVSYVASAEGIDEVVIALFGQLTNPYLYVDATSVPNIATNMTYTFDDEPLGDALYVCAILGNAFPFFEPNGYSYFRAYGAADPTGWYYGSAGFNDEVVGTSGTDIDWVDSATLHDGAVEIIAEWQNHKNVLRLQDDATPGEDPFIVHNITQAMLGTVEFWVGTNDVTETWSFNLREGGSNRIAISIQASKIQYTDSGAAQQDILDPAVNNTLYHIKVVWRADNTFDLYLNEVLNVDNQAMTANQGSGINNHELQGFGDSTDYLYLDAWGIIADSKYEEGYNLYDMYSNVIGNMGNPKVNKHQAQFNDFSNVRGGWDETTSKPFAPSDPLIAEHIQQYGKKLWRGRKIFSGAITQASLDAIVAGLKAWQGMVSNPIDASFKIKQYYYPVGYQVGVKFGLNNLIPDITSMIIVGNLTNFKRPNLIDLAVSTNITRRR